MGPREPHPSYGKARYWISNYLLGRQAGVRRGFRFEALISRPTGALVLLGVCPLPQHPETPLFVYPDSIS